MIGLQELTEEERQVMRTGLRMLARMIARRQLAVESADAAAGRETSERDAGGGGAGANGDEHE